MLISPVHLIIYHMHSVLNKMCPSFPQSKFYICFANTDTLIHKSLDTCISLLMPTILTMQTMSDYSTDYTKKNNRLPNLTRRNNRLI